MGDLFERVAQPQHRRSEKNNISYRCRSPHRRQRHLGEHRQKQRQTQDRKKHAPEKPLPVAPRCIVADLPHEHAKLRHDMGGDPEQPHLRCIPGAGQHVQGVSDASPGSGLLLMIGKHSPAEGQLKPQIGEEQRHRQQAHERLDGRQKADQRHHLDGRHEHPQELTDQVDQSRGHLPLQTLQHVE